MITINENNFQLLTVSSDKTGEVIDLFTAGTGTKVIILPESTHLKYLFIATGSCNVDLEFRCIGTNSNLAVCGLLLGTKQSNVQMKVNALIESSNTKADLHIVSFLTDRGSCILDGNVRLGENISQSAGHLLEENIILGNTVHVKTLPRLDVFSNDVQASHGATIQRIDNEKLFYLRSKGLTENEAKKLIIEGYFSQLFSIFGGQIDAARVKVHYIEELLKDMK